MSTAPSAHLLMTKWPRTSALSQHMRLRQRHPCPRNDKRCLSTSSARYTITTSEYFSNLEKAVVNALVQAGRCRKSSKRWPCHGLEVPAYKRATWVQPVLSYNRLPLLAQNAVEIIGSPFSKARLRGLVDYYESHSTATLINQMQIQIEGEPNAFRPTKDELEQKRMHLLLNSSELEQRNLEALHKQILLLESLLNMANDERHLRNLGTNFAEVWEQYQGLSDSPQRRILFLNSVARKSLLNIFMVSAKQSPATARRYLSFLDDMKISHLYISPRRWNTAMHIVGRSLGEVRPGDVENALDVWTYFDGKRRFQGDICTFNILLDVAVKGGHFSLADMILEEMRGRNIKFDRYTRAGLIYYHGVRGDGDAVRKVYWEYVEEEVLIETAVLNAVIASLLRAGEPEAAQHVYQRMKEMAEESKTYIGSSSPNAIAAVQRVLQAKKHDDNEQIRQTQEQQRVCPDAQTYSILVAYHVDSTGDLDQIARLLSDMQYLGIPSHGRIFCELFRGFNNRGGKSFTLWTSSTLDRVWTAFVLAADRGDGVYWEKWITIWVLRAYTVCAGRDTALQKWEIIKRNWRRASDYEDLMMSVISFAESRAARLGRQPRPTRATVDSVDVETGIPAQIESGFRI